MNCNGSRVLANEEMMIYNPMHLIKHSTKFKCKKSVSVKSVTRDESTLTISKRKSPIDFYLFQFLPHAPRAIAESVLLVSSCITTSALCTL